MKKFLAIVTASAALTGCAGLPFHTMPMAQGAIPPPASAPSEAAGDDPVAADDEASLEAGLPHATLTGEILYKYLVAEIAEQRGHSQAAYISMLSAAQQTRDPRIARRAAEIAMNAKEMEAALDAVRLWHETAPQSEEASQFLLTLLVASGRIEEAYPMLEERLRQAPTAARASLILQTHRLLGGGEDKPRAFLMLENLLAPYQEMPEVHLALAQAAFSLGDNARATQEAQAALKAMPRSELAILVLAQVTPDKQEATRLLGEFLQQNPKAREVRLAYARLLVESNQFSEADHHFKVLLQDQPDDLTSLYAIGLLNMQLRNLDAAEHYLSQFLEVLAASPHEFRDPTQALLMLSQIAEEKGDFPAALAWLDQVEGPTPEAQLELHFKRAQLHAKAGHVKAALAMLDEVKVEGEDRQIQVAVVKAQILKAADQPRQAFTVLQTALKRHPDNTGLLYDYAMAAEALKRFKDMEQALRKIIRLAPDNQHAYNALGYSLADRNVRLKEAYQLISRAFELAPEDPFIMDSMGWIEFRMGRLAEAEKLLRRAYQLRPDAEIAAHLGEVLWAKGRRDDAREVWRAASRQDPANATLKSTLARLQVAL